MDLIGRVQLQLATKFGDPATVPAADIAEVVRAEAGVISDLELLDIMRRLRQESSGAGPLDRLLAIPGVTDVLVNGPEDVWFDRGRGLERADLAFDSDAAVRQLAVRLAVACGRRLDDAQPYADGRLMRADGSSIRIHAIIPPLSDAGTCISLRVLRQAAMTLDSLVASGCVSQEGREVLSSIVSERHSFLIAGGTGSGKTTMLSAMLAEVPEDQRIICIEDTAELRPPHPHVVSLVARGRNVEGAGAVTMADLLKQALRMRPDRIILGEIRGAEVVDLLAALNTGHEGGAGTVHANSVHEVPARLEALGQLGGLPASALRSQLAAAVRYVVMMGRTPSGRQVREIAALTKSLELKTVWANSNGVDPCSA
ncbi:Putative conjugal transfer protein [Corynebacterium kalinowskii]|uniref:Conjugal transfer protein n=1 Tax=Corynebacterium kalinowskii TaxID=2675216 RepID=A0A6B8VJ03_9CORY|nr:TadA family conjugal transfer-associated ATPase [Corynebacterium kalinowskii]QGU03009.1 Putative conjugal transfer protein [Corynebacterium kalinowskii]